MGHRRLRPDGQQENLTLPTFAWRETVSYVVSLGGYQRTGRWTRIPVPANLRFHPLPPSLATYAQVPHFFTFAFKIFLQQVH